MKKGYVKGIVFGIVLLNWVICLLVVPNLLIVQGPAGVDKIYEGPYAGNYLVTDGYGSIKIINFTSNQIVWQTDEPKFFVHDSRMMPGGNSVLVGDSAADRVFEMSLTTKEILWEWRAKNSTKEQDSYCNYLNWTKFGLQQGWNETALSIVENLRPTSGFYSHLNMVQFLKGSNYNRSYDSVLISLRNFDLIIEVNYTAKIGEAAYMNITWHYGTPGNHSILFHPHSPKRWLNGHMTICDSENARVIEIDEQDQIVWEYRDKALRWVRDCELLPNGNYLITDADNNRIIEVNMSAGGQIVRIFSSLLFNPYSAELTDDNKVVVSIDLGASIVVFDYETGAVIQIIGFNIIVVPAMITFLIVAIYQTTDLIYSWKKMKGTSSKQRILTHSIYSKLILVIISVLTILILNYVLIFLWHYGLWHLFETMPRPG
jgi:WD40 repeat protein